MDFIDYREKLGIGVSNRELENEFFNRMFNVLDCDYDMENQISQGEYFDFCMQTGYPMQHGITTGECWDAIMKVMHNNSRSIKEFLPYYMSFINCQEDKNYKPFKRDNFKKLICESLKESHIPFDVFEEEQDYFIFPKGAKELDDALVSEPLMWLKGYSNSRKAFTKALKAYYEVTEENASDVADLFRKALETFFQEFFEKDKSLENLKSEYGNFLSKKGVPGEVKNNFEKLLESYTNYNNNYAKHHDKVSLNVLEYIMYQTGNLIRLIITINQEDNVNAD